MIGMKTLYVKINNISDVTNFVNMATAVNGDVLATKGRFCVDCKSMMGMFSIDTSTGFTVEYPETATDFENYIINFKAE